MVLIKIGVWIYHYNTSFISFIIIRSWYLLVKSYQGEYIPVTRIFFGSNVDLFVKYMSNQTLSIQWAGNGIGYGCKFKYVYTYCKCSLALHGKFSYTQNCIH